MYIAGLAPQHWLLICVGLTGMVGAARTEKNQGNRLPSAATQRRRGRQRVLPKSKLGSGSKLEDRPSAEKLLDRLRLRR